MVWQREQVPEHEMKGMPITMPTDPSAEPRVPLNRERVLHAAITVADVADIEALTMRRLGQELGVEAMALYKHVANKDDLLDGMLDAVVSDIAVPSCVSNGAGWKTAVRQSAISAHEVLLRHPWAARLWMTRQLGPARLRFGDALLGSLRAAGFSPEVRYHAYHTLQSHILGFTLQEANVSFDSKQLASSAQDFLSDVSSDKYPYLTEHVVQHLQANPNSVSTFEFGLDLILDGLDRLRETA